MGAVGDEDFWLMQVVMIYATLVQQRTEYQEPQPKMFVHVKGIRGMKDSSEWT